VLRKLSQTGQLQHLALKPRNAEKLFKAQLFCTTLRFSEPTTLWYKAAQVGL